MDSAGGVSSSSKRSAGGGRSEQSLETQGCFIGKVGEERDGVAQNAIVGFMPYYTDPEPRQTLIASSLDVHFSSISYCKFFLRLDKHTSKVGAVNGGAVDGAEDVNQHSYTIQVENKVAELECRVSAVEKKSNIHVWVIVLGLVAGLVAVYVNGV
ncbi:hypothetical protein PIB30_047824 [Stylosanthes scabra]|uniref:Uncharacterized protein n=1 Tax=Stylosanthes scabra TaxID=79078 RepID=A0ABU6ZFL1_9FABA|nr:hypothetical protein [Stylosanthes scabra]